MVRDYAIKNAWIGLAFVTAFFVLVYFIQKEALFNPIVGAFPLIAYVVFMSRTGRTISSEYEFRAPFRELFANTWVTGVLIFAIWQFFILFFYTVVDSSLNDMLYERSVETIEKMSGLLGEEKYEAMRENMNEADLQVNLKNTITGVLMGLIFPMAMLALFISAILHYIKPKEEIDPYESA